MTRSYRTALLAAAALGACGGAQPESDAAAALPAAAAPAPEAGEAPAAATGESARSRVTLDAEQEQVALLTASLDDDPNREQIVAFRAAGAPESPIHVGVIDYRHDEASWRMIWETATQALHPDTLRIRLVDLVGDPAPEIVVLGTAGDEWQTLDAYRRTPEDEASSAAYRAIARIVAAGTLEIGAAGGDGEAAVPLIARVKAPESDSGLDLRQLTYAWDAERGVYRLRRIDPLATQVDPAEPIADLYASPGVEPYEAFLTGPWYRDVPSGAIDGGSRRELLIFAADERLISVYDGHTLEQFEWVVSHRPLAAHLDAWARNPTIEAIGKTFSIEAESAEEIRVDVRGQEPHDRSRGVYRRLRRAEQDALLAAGEAPEAIAALNGRYRTADGLSIDFAGDRFVWTDAEAVRTGGFALRGRVLSMKFVGPRGAHLGYLTYVIDYPDIESSEQAGRSLRLTRVETASTVTGMAATPVLHLIREPPIGDRPITDRRQEGTE